MTSGPRSSSDNDYQGFHLYSSGSAFKFERICNAGGIAVLSIDAALKSGSSFDWAQKYTIQITPEEMPGFLCCVLGIIAEFRVQFHGASRRKSLEIVSQPERASMYLKIWNEGTPIGGPLPANKVFELSALGLKILSEQTGFDAPTCLALLRGTAGRLLASKRES